MFSYWKCFGWLVAGMARRRSLSPSSHLASFAWGKQKEARTLPLLRGGSSDYCCETRL